MSEELDHDLVEKWVEKFTDGNWNDEEFYLVYEVLEEILENGFPQGLTKPDADLPPLHERLRF